MIFYLKSEEGVTLITLNVEYENDEINKNTSLQIEFNEVELFKYINSISDLNIANVLKFKIMHLSSKLRREFLENKGLNGFDKNLKIVRNTLESFHDFDLISTWTSGEF